MKLEITPISVWEKLRSSAEPVIMYGTGNGADKVLDTLSEKGIEIQGVTASNTFVRERTFRGFRVMPISHFEETYESFTVIITFGTSIPEVMDNIYDLSQRHRVLVPVVPVIGTEVFDEEFLNKNRDKIEEAYELMADDFSKKIFKGYVNFLYGGELRDLKAITTPEDEAFNNILRLNETETYVDIGAYRGDTVDKLLSYTNNSYSAIICAEPDTKTYKKLMDHCGHLDNFVAYNCAVTGTDGEVGFSDVHGRQSAVGGSRMTPSLSLPTLCKGHLPSFIKIDSEGCEYDILANSGDILKANKPKLNVATYHRCEDIFTLPILIHSLNPEYKIHLRHHPYIPAWDTNVYCV